MAVYAIARLFPFLIGTVRTLLTALIPLSLLAVSIPHRYGKNFEIIHFFSKTSAVSIPHRYGKNSGWR